MIQDFKKICDLYYQSTYIPIRLYSTTAEVVHELPHLSNDFHPMIYLIPPETDISQDCVFLSDVESLFWGIVRDSVTNYAFFLGPISPIPLSSDAIKRIMVEHFIPIRYFEEIKELFFSTPNISAVQFSAILKSLYHQINHRFWEEELYDFSSNMTNDDLVISNKIISTSHMFYQEEEHKHTNSYELENYFFQCIEKGDFNALKNLLSDDSVKQSVALASTPIRNIKNSAIICISILSRNAIKAGVPSDICYTLNDLYIIEIEKAQDLSTLHKVTMHALKDYSTRIQNLQIPNGISPMVFQCIQYIGKSVNSNITVSDVAEHVHRSISHVSAQFKKELGFNISSFITRRKIEEAKMLLRKTDYSLVEISNYLCFSSQSYFQNVFKKVVKQTPLQYREENYNK